MPATYPSRPSPPSPAPKLTVPVGELEREHQGESFGEFWEEVFHLSVASVLACAASLEAYVNELLFHCQVTFPGIDPRLLGKIFEYHDKGYTPPFDKFKLVLWLRDKPEFDDNAKKT